MTSEMFLVFDIGCIECGESSQVVGVYPDEETAQAAADSYSNPKDAGSWGRPEWTGQHSVEVFEVSV